MVVRLKVAKVCYILVQAYASTDDSKSEFYVETQRVVEIVERRL